MRDGQVTWSFCFSFAFSLSLSQSSIERHGLESWRTWCINVISAQRERFNQQGHQLAAVEQFAEFTGLGCHFFISSVDPISHFVVFL